MADLSDFLKNTNLPEKTHSDEKGITDGGLSSIANSLEVVSNVDPKLAVYLRSVGVEYRDTIEDKVDSAVVDTLSSDHNLYNKDSPYSDKATFTVRDTVAPVLAGTKTSAQVKSNLLSIFQPASSFGPDAGESKPTPGKPRFRISDDPLYKSSFPNGVIPVKFDKENKFGFSTFQSGRAPKISDDEAYVPLSFTDLRPIGNVYRTVYFRPFITNLGETFAPDWNKTPFHGRVDPVATYQSTTRTIALGFLLVAFSPEDVKVIYDKLSWLSSLTYPEYDRDLMYSSGPVARMRIGDIINSVGAEGGLGLPGIIENLTYDYTDALWEVEKDYKVARVVKVDLAFTVLHDRPIGRGQDGKFGAIGQIVNGVYVPPGQGNQTPGGDNNLRFAQVDTIDSFRKVGGKNSNGMNSYTKLDNADKE